MAFVYLGSVQIVHSFMLPIMLELKYNKEVKLEEQKLEENKTQEDNKRNESSWLSKLISNRSEDSTRVANISNSPSALETTSNFAQQIQTETLRPQEINLNTFDNISHKDKGEKMISELTDDELADLIIRRKDKLNTTNRDVDR